MNKVRLKYLVQYQKGKVPTIFSEDASLFPYLSMEYLREKSDNVIYVEDDGSNILIDENEVLVLWDGANAGEIMLSKKGYLSSTMAILKPNEQYFHKRFFFYFLKSKERYFKEKASGTTIPHLDQDAFFNEHFETLPYHLQLTVANYLDNQSEKINRFIAKKQRFIELLKEQRQNLINEAVTKGINKNVKLKDSGIKWLGNIPESWEVRRLKNVCEVVLGKMLCNEDKGDYELKPYLKSKNIGWDNVIIEDVENMWFSKKELETYRIRRNDLLVSEGGEVGKTCIWRDELEECYIQNSVHKLTLFEDCSPEYYLYWMGMLGFIGHFKEIVNQVSIAHLTRDKIVKVKCLYPPFEEQKQIVQYIKTETATIDKTIAKTEREIELIKEYKEAMIAEAVMGKVDFLKSNI